MANYQSIEHDVLVVGAGGAGIRAAIEAAHQGGGHWLRQVASKLTNY